jgi:hypothetical protein
MFSIGSEPIRVQIPPGPPLLFAGAVVNLLGVEIETPGGRDQNMRGIFTSKSVESLTTHSDARFNVSKANKLLRKFHSG